MILTIEGTPQEIQTFLSQPLTGEVIQKVTTEEETQVDPIAKLRGNEAWCMPVGSENAITARTIIEQLDLEFNPGLNTIVVNHLKRVAEDPSSGIGFIDGSAQKSPHLFYRHAD
jgi:hypothetical protein